MENNFKNWNQQPKGNITNNIIDININGRTGNPSVTYNVEWRRETPVDKTKATVALVVEIFAFISEVWSLASDYSNFFVSPTSIDANILAKIEITGIVALVLLFLIVATISIIRVCKYSTRKPIGFGNLSLKGNGGKINLEKVSMRCPNCGNEMRYYNKPDEKISWIENGTIKKRVTKKKPAFECKANKEHCYSVD